MGELEHVCADCGEEYCPACWEQRPYVIEMKRKQRIRDCAARLANLAANLRWAALLTKSFNLGAFHFAMKDRYGADEWEPNVEGKSVLAFAPKWEQS